MPSTQGRRVLRRYSLIIAAASFLSTSLILVQTSVTFAHGAPSSPTQAYTPGQWFRPDGLSHQFRYEHPCSAALAAKSPNCRVTVLITMTAVIRTTSSPATQSGVVAYDYPYMSETITNDYKTCTAWFGTCGQYTEAKLVSTDYYDGASNAYNEGMTYYCGAAAWNCQGLAGTSNQAYDRDLEYEQDTAGPQLYNSSSGSQTKYARTRVHPDGSYTFYNTCAGFLC